MKIITEKKKYSRTVKCPHCSGQLDRNTEPFTEHSGRFYHQECYSVRFAEMEDRKRLIEYICKIQNIDRPNGYILKQIKNFQEGYGYSVKGMLTTLKYVHEVKEIPVLEGTGVGIIEYFYDKAYLYHVNLSKVRKSNSGQEINTGFEIIYSSPHRKRKKKMIDIEDI